MICGLCGKYRTRRSGDMLGHLGGCARARWARVAELRREGRDDEADGVVSRILGSKKGPPMTAEARAAVRAYEAGHREEINAKRRRKRLLRRVVARARKGGVASRP